MRSWFRCGVCVVVLALVCCVAGSAAGADPNPPFVVTASSGRAAGSHIDATVTRSVGGKKVTLPAALVPALEPGDVVDLDFPDYRRPPSSVNYHVNVAFITETARQHWFFERSTAADQLFWNGRKRANGRTGALAHIHFVYGTGDYRGIPIFFIVPEDAKTRGVDGVRDYVGAHPTDFVDMAQGTNDAVDRYSFLNDFLTSLGSGSIDPVDSRYRIETVAQSLGVSPSTIDACYVAGEPTAEVNNCIQQALNATVYQPNFTAPTQATFLGGVAGAAAPLTLAPYLTSLLTVWHLFVKTGHLEYEYLPTTIELADPSAMHRDELLMGLKVPTVRPPAAYSDVLFFTIGDPQATERPPVVVDDAPANGICERSKRFTIPLHFDHTSRYLNDSALLVTPDGRDTYGVPLDARTLSAPAIDRAHFAPSEDGGYSVALVGRFGFDGVVEPALETARLAFPSNARWTLVADPDHPPIAGRDLDVVASSATAACLSRAELQIGSAPPIPLAAKQLDSRRVEFTASLAGVPPGPARIRFDEDDPAVSRPIQSEVALGIEPPPASVDEKNAVASLGDAFISLTGSGFERVRGLIVNGVTYTKEAASSATTACFDGPPFVHPGLETGQHVTAQLLDDTGDAQGQVFSLTVALARPNLVSASIAEPSPSPYLSTEPLVVTLADAGGLPRQLAVRVRQAGDASTPCGAALPDPTAVALADSDVHVRSAKTVAVDFRADVLHDRAFGKLEMQVVDAATGAGSNWFPMPGTFARAPLVTRIDCPADAGAKCRLYGSNLAAIDAVKNAAGDYEAPGLDCPPNDKGVTCVYVPRAQHYLLRLVDAATIETLHDALIAPRNGS